ncbi:hypothetical protein [Caballeronia sordidicola]|uniref:hypothetical protein n=1 Tax=Caballeronia sordidicola TaxID=196367 RepID=UPI00117743B2|nr:hypothetical protein [Caballeronia sordidicola]
MLRKLTSRGLSFSHLASVSPVASDDTPPPDDKDGKKGKKADDSNPPSDDQNTGDGDSNGKKGKADDDTPQKDDPDNKGGKKGKAEDSNPDENADDDDDEEEMRGTGAAAQARRRERARCACILGSKAAAYNVVLAANLAFKTTMTRQEALAVLEETPAAAAAPLASQRQNPNLGNGGDRNPNSKQAIASGWEVAMKKAQAKR